MKQFLCGLLALSVIASAATTAYALGADFSKAEIAAAGKHCVHGYWVNETTFTYFAGDAALLNADLRKYLEFPYASRKVVIHAGTTKASSPWDKQPRDIAADWSIVSWDEPEDAAKALPRMRLQFDVWLGSRVRLEDLDIPKEFEVVSGGEIDKFIQKRKVDSK